MSKKERNKLLPIIATLFIFLVTLYIAGYNTNTPQAQSVSQAQYSAASGYLTVTASGGQKLQVLTEGPRKYDVTDKIRLFNAGEKVKISAEKINCRDKALGFPITSRGTIQLLAGVSIVKGPCGAKNYKDAEVVSNYGGRLCKTYSAFGVSITDGEVNCENTNNQGLKAETDFVELPAEEGVYCIAAGCAQQEEIYPDPFTRFGQVKMEIEIKQLPDLSVLASSSKNKDNYGDACGASGYRCPSNAATCFWQNSKLNSFGLCMKNSAVGRGIPTAPPPAAKKTSPPPQQNQNFLSFSWLPKIAGPTMPVNLEFFSTKTYEIAKTAQTKFNDFIGVSKDLGSKGVQTSTQTLDKITRTLSDSGLTARDLAWKGIENEKNKLDAAVKTLQGVKVPTTYQQLQIAYKTLTEAGITTRELAIKGAEYSRDKIDQVYNDAKNKFVGGATYTREQTGIIVKALVANEVTKYQLAQKGLESSRDKLVQVSNSLKAQISLTPEQLDIITKQLIITGLLNVGILTNEQEVNTAEAVTKDLAEKQITLTRQQLETTRSALVNAGVTTTNLANKGLENSKEKLDSVSKELYNKGVQVSRENLEAIAKSMIASDVATRELAIKGVDGFKNVFDKVSKDLATQRISLTPDQLKTIVKVATNHGLITEELAKKAIEKEDSKLDDVVRVLRGVGIPVTKEQLKIISKETVVKESLSEKIIFDSVAQKGSTTTPTEYDIVSKFFGIKIQGMRDAQCKMFLDNSDPLIAAFSKLKLSCQPTKSDVGNKIKVDIIGKGVAGTAEGKVSKDSETTEPATLKEISIVETPPPKDSQPPQCELDIGAEDPIVKIHPNSVKSLRARCTDDFTEKGDEKGDLKITNFYIEAEGGKPVEITGGQIDGYVNDYIDCDSSCRQKALSAGAAQEGKKFRFYVETKDVADQKSNFYTDYFMVKDVTSPACELKNKNSVTIKQGEDKQLTVSCRDNVKLSEIVFEWDYQKTDESWVHDSHTETVNDDIKELSWLLKIPNDAKKGSTLTWFARAKDAEGNSVSAPDLNSAADEDYGQLVILDDVAPTVSVVDSPTALSANQRATIMFNAGDQETGLESVSVFLNGKEVTNKKVTYFYSQNSDKRSITLDKNDYLAYVASPLNQQYNVKWYLVVKDKAGNERKSTESTFTLDPLCQDPNGIYDANPPQLISQQILDSNGNPLSGDLPELTPGTKIKLRTVWQDRADTTKDPQSRCNGLSTVILDLNSTVIVGDRYSNQKGAKTQTTVDFEISIPTPREQQPSSANDDESLMIVGRKLKADVIIRDRILSGRYGSEAGGRIGGGGGLGGDFSSGYHDRIMPGSTVVWNITAYDKVGNVAKASQKSFRVKDVEPPEITSIKVNATKVSTILKGGVRFRACMKDWNINPASYKIEVKENAPPTQSSSTSTTTTTAGSASSVGGAQQVSSASAPGSISGGLLNVNAVDVQTQTNDNTQQSSGSTTTTTVPATTAVAGTTTTVTTRPADTAKQEDSLKNTAGTRNCIDYDYIPSPNLAENSDVEISVSAKDAVGLETKSNIIRFKIENPPQWTEDRTPKQAVYGQMMRFSKYWKDESDIKEAKLYLDLGEGSTFIEAKKFEAGFKEGWIEFDYKVPRKEGLNKLTWYMTVVDIYGNEGIVDPEVNVNKDTEKPSYTGQTEQSESVTFDGNNKLTVNAKDNIELDTAQFFVKESGDFVLRSTQKFSGNESSASYIWSNDNGYTGTVSWYSIVADVDGNTITTSTKTFEVQAKLVTGETLPSTVTTIESTTRPPLSTISTAETTTTSPPSGGTEFIAIGAVVLVILAGAAFFVSKKISTKAPTTQPAATPQLQ